MTFQPIKMEVTQTVTNAVTKESKRERVGDVTIFVPLVSGLKTAVQASVEGKPAVTDEGLPVYEADMDNWLQNAILSQVKAQARNKLVPKTIELKDGATIATDWAGLTAESVGGGAVHLALIREVKALFAQWVATLGKSKGAIEKITGAFNNLDVLRVADATSKEKIAQYVSDFADSLDEETQAKYSKYILRVVDVATSEAIEADDF